MTQAGLDLQGDMASAFVKRTAPGAGLSSLATMSASFHTAKRFLRFLSAAGNPVARITDLRSHHIDEFIESVGGLAKARAELQQLRSLLRHFDNLPAEVSERLSDVTPRAVIPSDKSSYSRDEFRRIADAARSDLRAAAARIRGNRAELERFRSGDVDDPTRRLELLDIVDATGSLPRYPPKPGGHVGPVHWWVQTGGYGSVGDIMSWSHLTCLELVSAAVLLAVMTGENPTVVMEVPASHLRADGHTDTGKPAVSILETLKPRRGKRAYMNLVLSDVPDWISIPSEADHVSARDQLHTPFGLYALLHELTDRSRAITGIDRLLVGYHRSGSFGSGLRALRNHQWFALWSDHHRITPDDSAAQPDSARPEALKVTLWRLRLTYLQLHQKPVAHTEATLVNDYLSRDRASLGDYRRVVADALREEVGKARARGVMEVLSKDEIDSENWEIVGARHGVDADTLRRMAAGRLDTVMNSCVDNRNGPFGSAGETCTASFMLCLGCPCARALPRHLVVQVLVFDRLTAKRSELTPLSWVKRFGVAHAQLQDLLSQHDSIDITSARESATEAQIAMVESFVSRELDVR